MTNDPAPAPVPQTKKPRGFLFYAAVAAGGLLLALALTTAALALYARSMIIAYTDTAASAMPVAEIPAADYEALEKRVEAFRTSLQQSSAVPELVLNADEINALLARKSDSTDRVSDMLRVTIDGDKIGGQVSLPLDKIGFPLPAGRYLNGSAAFKISMENGVLIITADSMTLKGKPLAEAIMSQLRSENLARNVYRKPKNAEALRKIESIQVKDGRIYIKPRRA